MTWIMLGWLNLSTLEHVGVISGVAIAFMFVWHIIERYYRHVAESEEFFEFLKSK